MTKKIGQRNKPSNNIPVKAFSIFDKKYTGGLDGSKGYHFEDAYVLSQLPTWLSQSEIQGFQQELLTDLELFFESGSRWFIQIKNHHVTLSEFRAIIQDFNTRQAAGSDRYEKFIIAGPSFVDPLEQLRRYLERFRSVQNYTKEELALSRSEISLKLQELKCNDLIDFVIEKVLIQNDLGWIKNEEVLRNSFTGSLVNKFEIGVESANDLYLRTARFLIVERGKPVELQLFRIAIERKQLEDQKSHLSQFDLVTENFLNSYRNDSVKSFFYDGTVPTWSDIVHCRDITRDVMHEIISQVDKWNEGGILVPILAEGGEGKSTLLRRVAVELLNRGKIVLYHRRDMLIANIREVEWAARLVNQCIYVLIDDAPRIQNLNGFIKSLADLCLPIVLIVTSRTYEWVTLRSVYSANITTNDCEYKLEGLSDNELMLLFKRLAHEGLIHSLSDTDLQSAIDYYGRKTKRKLLVLVLELIQGKRVKEIIRDEIERVRKMGDYIFSVYRDTCLMGSVQSFITLTMLKRLTGDGSIDPRIIGQLPGLIEVIGDRVYPRHDRIAEIATDLLFEGADEERGDMFCKLIDLAQEEGQIDVINTMSHRYKSIPQSQLFKVINHQVDKLYCAGEFVAVQEVFESLESDFANGEIFRNLLASKTPLIWEKIIFPFSEGTLDWDKIQMTTGLTFSCPKCTKITANLTPISSLKNGLEWAGIYSRGAWKFSKLRNFFEVISDKIYKWLLVYYPENMMEVNFEYALFLNEQDCYEEAIKLYKIIIEKMPTHANAHACLAVSLYLTDDYNDALKHYREARTLDPISVFRYDIGILGEMLERLGELRDLVEYKRDSSRQHFTMMRKLNALLKPCDLKIPQTPAERWNQEYRTKDYTEKAEQSTAEYWDEVLKFVGTLNSIEQNKLAKQIFSTQFGELRKRRMLRKRKLKKRDKSGR